MITWFSMITFHKKKTVRKKKLHFTLKTKVALFIICFHIFLKNRNFSQSYFFLNSFCQLLDFKVFLRTQNFFKKSKRYFSIFSFCVKQNETNKAIFLVQICIYRWKMHQNLSLFSKIQII